MSYRLYCISQTKGDTIHTAHLHAKQIVQTKSSPADVNAH